MTHGKMWVTWVQTIHLDSESGLIGFPSIQFLNYYQVQICYRKLLLSLNSFTATLLDIFYEWKAVYKWYCKLLRRDNWCDFYGLTTTDNLYHKSPFQKVTFSVSEKDWLNNSEIKHQHYLQLIKNVNTYLASSSCIFSVIFPKWIMRSYEWPHNSQRSSNIFKVGLVY